MILKIHPAIRIRADGLPDPIKNRLVSRWWESFVTEEGEIAGHPEVTIEPLGEGSILPGSLDQMDWLFGSSIGQLNGIPAVFLSHKAIPVVQILFSSPIRIQYQDHPRAVSQLHAALVYVVKNLLLNQDVLLCHGAILSGSGTSVLVVGHQGVGKTLLTLQLLREGWGYLTDDKSLIQGGVASPFHAPFIWLKDHHFSMIPWLRDALPSGSRAGTVSSYRQGIRKLVRSNLHKKLIPRGGQFLNPEYRLEVRELFPGIQILDQCRPEWIVLLRHGLQTRLDPLSQEEGFRLLQRVQELSQAGFAPIDWCLELYGYRPIRDLNDVIRENFREAQFVLATVPPDDSMAVLCKELTTFFH